MKSTAIVCAIAAASLGFGSLSFAQTHDWRGAREELPRVQQPAPRQAEQRDQNRHERRMDHREDRRVDRHEERRAEHRFDRREDRRFDHGDMRRNDRRDYYNARGPEFRRGGYIPREFRNHQYVVTDYRPYRLSPPPRGHEWVQVGADYVLIAIATGLIAHIVLSH